MERAPGFGIGKTFLVAQLVRNPPAIWETWVRSLSWEDPLKKGKATHADLECSDLENSMDCIVHRVAKSRAQLSDFHFSLIQIIPLTFSKLLIYARA